MIKFVLFLLSLSYITPSLADTMGNYMAVINNIPRMELKADQQAQAWARSARHVLTITTESIAETLIQSNEIAKTQGKPLFCLPVGVALDAASLNELIVKTYNDFSGAQDKNNMTVSQLALIGVTKKYGCNAAS